MDDWNNASLALDNLGERDLALLTSTIVKRMRREDKTIKLPFNITAIGDHNVTESRLHLSQREL